jgi:hypothetical protein
MTRSTSFGLKSSADIVEHRRLSYVRQRRLPLASSRLARRLSYKGTETLVPRGGTPVVHENMREGITRRTLL